MNVYDFDKTIYYPDSSYHFFLFCLKNYPWAVWPSIPACTVQAIRFKIGAINTKALKETLFSFLCRIPDIDRAVSDFWEQHRNNLQGWYLKQKTDDDLIISASPDFLLRPMAEELGVHLISTLMDRNTGKISGENCHDKEKVPRFRAVYSNERIENFYSDSLSDAPLAHLAEKAWLVKKGRLSPWPEKN